MTPAAKVSELARLEGVRRRRVELAQTALASAVSLVVSRRDSLVRNEGRIAEIDRAQAELTRWLTERPQAPLIAGAVARQGALDVRHQAELSERERHLAAFAEAETARAGAAAALAHARASLDVVSLRLTAARNALARVRETAAEAEFEGRKGRVAPWSEAH